MVLHRDLNSKAPPSDERGKAAMDGGLRRRVAAKAMDGLSAAGAWMRRSGRSAHREVRARAGQIPPSAPCQYLKGFRLSAEIPFFVFSARGSHLGPAEIFNCHFHLPIVCARSFLDNCIQTTRCFFSSFCVVVAPRNAVDDGVTGRLAWGFILHHVLILPAVRWPIRAWGISSNSSNLGRVKRYEWSLRATKFIHKEKRPPPHISYAMGL